ncbi:hypothetical protein DV736_g4841, partial [Chaetothyriales sp. CBS 134916]
MAVLKNTLFAASVLASSALAAPFGPAHGIQGLWGAQTKTVTDWITVNEQATVWVDGQGRPVRTDFPGGDNGPWGTPTGATPSPAAASSSVTSVPAAPAPSEAASSSPTSSPSPSYSPAVFNSEPEPTTTATPSTWTPEYTPSTAPTTTASTSSWVPAYTPAASSSSTTSAAAAASSSSSSSSSSSGGVCVGSSSNCVGDITHWDGGLGACGWNVDTSSDMQVALPYELMGTQSNNNPYCGKSLTIIGPSGNQVKATVGDKCMGCTGYSIDLTDTLFSTVDPSGDGRVHDIQWYFD